MGSLRLLLCGTLVAVFAFGLVPTTAAGGTTRTVPTSPGCATIQACVNASGPGDTITIKKGTYFENVSVPVGLDGLTIQGQLRFGRCSTPGAAVLDGSPGGVDGDGFDVLSNNVTIRCLTVQNGAIGIDVDADGFQIQGDNNTLTNNRADRNLKDGFDVESGTGNVLDGNFARDNRAEGIENNGTDTVLTDNSAGANRIDCANDGTLATNTNNFCSDGSNFNPPPEVESTPGRR